MQRLRTPLSWQAAATTSASAINVAAHTYSAYVTPPGGSEQTIASNYAFRTEQAGVSSLNNFDADVDATPGGSPDPDTAPTITGGSSSSSSVPSAQQLQLEIFFEFKLESFLVEFLDQWHDDQQQQWFRQFGRRQPDRQLHGHLRCQPLDLAIERHSGLQQWCADSLHGCSGHGAFQHHRHHRRA